MIRLNLYGPSFRRKLNVYPFLVGVLVAMLIGQALRIGWLYLKALTIEKEVQELRARLDGLEARKTELFAKAADVVAVAGALVNRNDWYRNRERSPIRILSKIERSLPPGGSLLAFSATRGGGTLRFEIGDYEGGQAWVKGCFGQFENRLNLEEKTDGKFRIQFAWNE